MTTKRTQLETEYLRMHVRHMQHAYGLRWGLLVLSVVCIVIGTVMTFKGLTGSFNWAFDAPYSIGSKLTNASPGIVCGIIGFLLAVVVMLKGFSIVDQPDRESRYESH